MIKPLECGGGGCSTWEGLDEGMIEYLLHFNDVVQGLITCLWPPVLPSALLETSQTATASPRYQHFARYFRVVSVNPVELHTNIYVYYLFFQATEKNENIKRN